MKRIDLRIYVDDEAVDVRQKDMEAIAQSMSTLVKDGINKMCNPHCPEGFVTIMYSIEDDADYPNDMYM